MSGNEMLAQEALKYDTEYRAGKVTLREIPKAVRQFAKSLPEQAVSSGRLLFVSEQLSGDSHVTERMSQVAAEWNSLSEHEKSQYDARAARAQQEYERALRALLAQSPQASASM